MSTDRDVTRIVRSWLEDGATALPDRVLDNVLDQLPATPQRRAWWPAWRLREMNSALKLAIAAAAVVVVAIVGINLLPRSEGVGGSGTSASPAPSSTASPSPSLSRSPAPSPALFPTAHYRRAAIRSSRLWAPGVCAWGRLAARKRARRTTRSASRSPSGRLVRARNQSVVPSVESYSPPGGADLLFSARRLVVHRLAGLWGIRTGLPTGPNIPTGTTVDEFVTALVDHPDLDVTSPVDVTLGGYSGQYLELQAPANIARRTRTARTLGECAYYFVWEPGIYAQGPNALWRIWVLDVDGVRVVVRSDSFPGTTPTSPSPTPGDRGLDPDRALTRHRVGRRRRPARSALDDAPRPLELAQRVGVEAVEDARGRWERVDRRGQRVHRDARLDGEDALVDRRRRVRDTRSPRRRAARVARSTTIVTWPSVASSAVAAGALREVGHELEGVRAGLPRAPRASRPRRPPPGRCRSRAAARGSRAPRPRRGPSGRPSRPGSGPGGCAAPDRPRRRRPTARPPTRSRPSRGNGGVRPDVSRP